MKLKLLLILSLFNLYHLVISQEPKIVFNAYNEEIEEHPSIEVDQDKYILIEIKDINLFRYSVTLTESQNNTINSERLSEGNTQIKIEPSHFNINTNRLNIQVVPRKPNSETKKLKLLEKVEFDLKRKLEVHKLKVKEAEKSYSNAEELITEYDDLKKEQTKIADKINSIKNTTNEQKDNNLLKNLNEQKSKVDSKLNYFDSAEILQAKQLVKEHKATKEAEYKKTIINYEYSIDSVKHEYNNIVQNDTSNSSRYESFNNSLLEYISSISELNRLTDIYLRLIRILYSDQSFKEIRNEKKNLSYDILKDRNATGDDLLKFCLDGLREIDKNYLLLSKKYGDLESLPNNTEAIEAFEKISMFHGEINLNSYYSFFQQIAKAFDAINISNFTLKHKTFILSDNADDIRYSLKATPIIGLPSSIETKPINLSCDFKIKRGVKIDISSGFFWNFFLHDKSYRFEKVSDTSTKVVEEDNDNVFLPSYGVLFNLYRRSNKNTKFGFSTGFSTNSERVNYCIGFSVLIGRSERLNINFGVAGAQVKYASDMYKTGTTLNIPLADLPDDVPLREPSPFRVGPYLGVTFNVIGSKNKETLNRISTL